MAGKDTASFFAEGFKALVFPPPWQGKKFEMARWAESIVANNKKLWQMIPLHALQG